MNRSTWRVFTLATTTRICPEESRPCSQAAAVNGSERESREVLRSWEASPWDMRNRTRIQDAMDTDPSAAHSPEESSAARADRKGGVSGRSGLVGVELGVRGGIKKKKKQKQ